MRLEGLDIARFVAFIGMVLVNFRLAAEVADDGSFAGFFIDHIEGRASALFVVLAGIGFSLGRPDVIVTYKRAAFLFVIGMIDMMIFSADILHFYAMYFLVGIFALRFEFKGLIYLGLGIIALWFLMLIYIDYDLGWDWAALSYTDFWTPLGFIRNSLFNGWHPVAPWAAFFVFGMALGRLDLTTRTTHRRMAIGGGLLALAFYSLSWMGQSAIAGFAEILTLHSIPPGPLYVLFSTCTTMSAIGIILMITPTLTRLKITPWLVAPGRQTLTLYAAHILLGMGILEALDLLNGSLTNPEIFKISLLFCLLTMIYARLWAIFAKRGPLEWVMRRISG